MQLQLLEGGSLLETSSLVLALCGSGRWQHWGANASQAEGAGWIYRNISQSLQATIWSRYTELHSPKVKQVHFEKHTSLKFTPNYKRDMGGRESADIKVMDPDLNISKQTGCGLLSPRRELGEIIPHSWSPLALLCFSGSHWQKDHSTAGTQTKLRWNTDNSYHNWNSPRYPQRVEVSDFAVSWHSYYDWQGENNTHVKIKHGMEI